MTFDLIQDGDCFDPGLSRQDTVATLRSIADCMEADVADIKNMTNALEGGSSEVGFSGHYLALRIEPSQG